MLSVFRATLFDLFILNIANNIIINSHSDIRHRYCAAIDE